MSQFISLSDFSTGLYKLPLATATNDVLQARMDYVERDTLITLLGATLYQKLITYMPTTITSGPLVVGQLYTIKTFATDDDFTNIADVKIGVINSDECTFIATGTTPTNYSNGSLIVVNSALYILQNKFVFDNSVAGDYLVTSDYGLFNWGWNNIETWNSNGLTDLLTIAVYKDAITKDQYKAGQSGLIKNGAENGNVVGGATALRQGERLWNTNGYTTWMAIAYLCRYYLPQFYSDYNGKVCKIEYSSII